MQRELLIEVYQGEHARCRDNVKFGKHRVQSLPSKPAGEAVIDVRFSYDLNGIMEVESTIAGTNKTATLVIEKRPGTLSRKEIAAVREAMKRLKFHPRDALPNRTALARCFTWNSQTKNAPTCRPLARSARDTGQSFDRSDARDPDRGHQPVGSGKAVGVKSPYARSRSFIRHKEPTSQR